MDTYTKIKIALRKEKGIFVNDCQMSQLQYTRRVDVQTKNSTENSRFGIDCGLRIFPNKYCDKSGWYRAKDYFYISDSGL